MPSLLFEEPLLLPAKPLLVGTDITLRLADDVIIVRATSAIFIIGRTLMPPPTAPSFTAVSLSMPSLRSISFGPVASHPVQIPCTTWIPQITHSTLVLQYVKCEIQSFPTPLAFILEGEGHPTSTLQAHAPASANIGHTQLCVCDHHYHTVSQADLQHDAIWQ